MKLASMNVFCSMWKLEDVIFSKSLSLLWDFFNRHIVVFFETSVLKEVRILHYPHNDSAVLILMLMLSSRIKLSYTMIIQTWKVFVADFFMIKFFTLFISWLFTISFINQFFWKTQSIPESMFLNNTTELL